MDDPKNCDRCKADLRGGWSERHRGNERVEVVCFACDREECVAKYLKDGVLSSKFATDCAIEGVRREYGRGNRLFSAAVFECLDFDVRKVNLAVRRFERVVWFAGMAEAVRASTSSHMCGEGAGYKILTMSSAGRWMATISGEDGASVTVITEEDSNVRGCMGLQGIDATAARAVELLALVETAPPELCEAKGNGFFVDASLDESEV